MKIHDLLKDCVPNPKFETIFRIMLALSRCIETVAKFLHFKTNFQKPDLARLVFSAPFETGLHRKPSSGQPSHFIIEDVPCPLNCLRP
jgi:hypothetical protein